MILTSLRVHWLNLKRDRVALGLTFVVPIIFFSIFASIFASMNQGGSGSKTRTMILDLAKNDVSRRFEAALKSDRETFSFPEYSGDGPLTESSLERLVSDGKITLGIVFPEDMQIRFDGQAPPIRIYADTRKNPIAHQMINGILQKVAMTAAPGFLFNQGMEMMERFGGELTDSQKQMVRRFSALLEANDATGIESSNDDSKAVSDGDSSFQFNGLVGTEIRDVREQADKRRGKQGRAMVSSYASGIAVMFLLFSMAGAASGILEEQESGTLDRVLDSKLGLNGFLFSHWLFTSIVGFVQVTVMFVWGWFQFGLDLFSPDHLPGFIVVTVVTAGAAAAFGLLLGSFCRSRGQLNGISTTVVLIMSALGGSMIPRFVMKNNEMLDFVGRFTFNAWALDAYENVFWRDKPLSENILELTVLLSMTLVFLALARFSARRWKRN